MIHTHSLGRAVRYYPERTAFASGEERSTFCELHDRVGRIAAGLTKRGFRKGDRLALLLPNEREYVERVRCVMISRRIQKRQCKRSIKKRVGGSTSA